MSLGGNDGTKHDIDAPTRGSGNHAHPARVSPSTTRVHPSEKMAHPRKSLPLSRRALGRYGYLALG